MTMLVRGDQLSKTMSAYLVERIQQHPSIDVRLETQLTELHASAKRLTGVATTEAAGNKGTDPVDALFLSIGGQPHTGWYPPNTS